MTGEGSVGVWLVCTCLTIEDGGDWVECDFVVVDVVDVLVDWG